MKENSGRFRPGQSGNPVGRPKNPEIQELRDALQKAAKEHDETFIESVVKRAFRDSNLAVAVLRKLLPDRQHVEADVSGEMQVTVINSFSPPAARKPLINECYPKGGK